MLLPLLRSLLERLMARQRLLLGRLQGLLCWSVEAASMLQYGQLPLQRLSMVHLHRHRGPLQRLQ